MTTIEIIEFNINRHFIIQYGSIDEKALAHIFTLMFDHVHIQQYSVYAAMFDLALTLVDRLNR